MGGDIMKYKIIIDENVEESIVITAKEKNEMIYKIEKIINMHECRLMAYSTDEIIPIDIQSVYAFYTKDSKIYVLLNDKKCGILYMYKKARRRMYEIKAFSAFLVRAYAL